MGELETYADTRVMQPAARAVCSATLAIFALIAVFCVVNEDTISTHESADKSDGIIGDKLLRQQAQVLNDKRALKNRGKNLEAFDNMMNTWTAPKEDMDLTNKLVADAPKKKPWAEDDGIYGDDILSAVSMGGHKKPDEMKTFGSITDDDFDANSLLND